MEWLSCTAGSSSVVGHAIIHRYYPNGIEGIIRRAIRRPKTRVELRLPKEH